MPHCRIPCLPVVVVCLLAGLTGPFAQTVDAGMPALLPTGWTAESSVPGADNHSFLTENAAARRLQALSFFVAVFLLSAWSIQRIWASARRDFPALPEVTYRRAAGLLTLWGLAFIVVLTMISGARELMTPGAWRKQGWTYGLAASTADAGASDRNRRKAALEQLRTAAWQFAAVNEGRLPNATDPSVSADLWQIPGHAGLRFMTRQQELSAEGTGRLYVFEPDVEGDERMVLLTNGFIGTMSSDVIRQTLARSNQAGLTRARQSRLRKEKGHQ